MPTNILGDAGVGLASSMTLIDALICSREQFKKHCLSLAGVDVEDSSGANLYLMHIKLESLFAPQLGSWLPDRYKIRCDNTRKRLQQQ